MIERVVLVIIVVFVAATVVEVVVAVLVVIIKYTNNSKSYHVHISTCRSILIVYKTTIQNVLETAQKDTLELFPISVVRILIVCK